MIRTIALTCLTLITGCAAGQDPLQTVRTGLSTITQGDRRGPVEVFVKTNHPALLADITAGGGQTLDRAFDLANVPMQDRALSTLRLQSDRALYGENLDALTAALVIMGE